MRTFKRLGAVMIAAMATAMVACGGGADAVGDGSAAAAGAAALTFEAAVTPASTATMRPAAS